MKEGGIGGKNTIAGGEFEKKVDLISFLRKKYGYSVRKDKNKAGLCIYYLDELVARSFPKYDFYRYLGECGVDWKLIISKRLLPDGALYVVIRDTLFIIEIKFQQGGGSVDEKLQTCDFKRKQYLKLVSKLGLRVEFVYVLNDWFQKPEYKDSLDYIHSMNCHYMFERLPLAWLGLPDPDK